MRRAVSAGPPCRLPPPARRLASPSQRPQVAQPLARGSPQNSGRPIFVIGCPRAGDSALLPFAPQPELRSIHNEGHIRRTPTTIPRTGLDSDALGAEESPSRADLHLPRGPHVRAQSALRRQDRENCLRIPCEKLFPGATFLFLRRRAAARVNSLIEAWKARPRFVKYRLPEPLEPRRIVGTAGLADQDGASSASLGSRRSARADIVTTRPPGRPRERRSSRWLEVAYEDLGLAR
jgi:hypothetical protein